VQLETVAGPSEQEEDIWRQYSSQTDGVSAAFPGEIQRGPLEMQGGDAHAGTLISSVSSDGTYYSVGTYDFDPNSEQMAEVDFFNLTDGDTGGGAQMQRLTVGGHPAAQYDDYDQESGIYRRSMTIVLPTCLVMIGALRLDGQPPADFDYFVSTLQLTP